MLFWVKQAILGRDEIQAPLKTCAWEAKIDEPITSGAHIYR